MKIGTIKPTATLVAQYPAGCEVVAIKHDGKIFLPVMTEGDFDGDDAPTPKKAEPGLKPIPTSKKVEPDATTDDESTGYTEDELQEMEVKDLMKICKDNNITIPAEGKNSNKKLRLLILAAQEAGELKSKDADEDEKPAKGKSKKEADPEPDAAPSELATDVATVLEDFDGGKLNKKKAVAKLIAMAVSEDVEDTDITEKLEAFEEDGSADIDEYAEEIAALLNGKPKKASKADKKKPAGKGKKEVLVEPEDLEVGQRVSVYWLDQDEWYDGVVKSIKKGKVTIDYDDETTEVIDENNTKIKLLED